MEGRATRLQPAAVSTRRTASDAGRGGIDFRELRQLVPIAQVLELLGWAPVNKYGVQWRGACPIHKSPNARSTSFSVNVQRNIWQCCSHCARGGNQLELYALATGREVAGGSVFDACQELCESLRIDRKP